MGRPVACVRFVLAGFVSAAVLAHAAVAGADDSPAARPAYRPGQSMPGPFRPWHFREGWELQIDRFWARRTDETTSSPGFGIAFGSVSHRIPNTWFLIGTKQIPLRILDSKSFSVSLSRHLLRGGGVMGAFDVSGGFGFSTLTVDVVHADWSAGLLSPLATAGIGLRMGRVRLGFSGYVEYLWRWTADDIWVRGFSLTVALDDPCRVRPE